MYQIIDGKPTIIKDPDESLLYGVDAADVLSEGAVITSWSASADAGITLGAVLNSGSVVFCLVSGGTVGTTYAVTFTWNCAASGEVGQRTIYITIVQR